MPRGRFISRTITESAQLASARVSLEAALLFTWSIPHLDCDGRMVAGAMVVKGKIFPLRDDIPTERIPGLWGELVAAKLVAWYEVEGVQFVAFPAFGLHQVGIRKRREAPSRIPSPKSLDAKHLPNHSTPNSTKKGDKGAELLPIREVKNFPTASVPVPPAATPTGSVPRLGGASLPAQVIDQSEADRLALRRAKIRADAEGGAA